MNLTAAATYKITCTFDPSLNDAFQECFGDIEVTSPLVAGQKGNYYYSARRVGLL